MFSLRCISCIIHYLRAWSLIIFSIDLVRVFFQIAIRAVNKNKNNFNTFITLLKILEKITILNNRYFFQVLLAQSRSNSIYDGKRFTFLVFVDTSITQINERDLIYRYKAMQGRQMWTNRGKIY